MQSCVTLTEISKSFNDVEVLHPVSLCFEYGQIHALVGENGAGKSTMMKIIAGIQPPSSGTVAKDGTIIDEFSPSSARKKGIALIHQELSYIPELTVAENIFLGREPRKKNGLIDYRKMISESKGIFESLGISINPILKMRSLRQASKQLVEIAKAVSVDADVIIMDEPTSSLSYHETEKLLQLIRSLAWQEKCIIFISHKLDEVYSIADVVSVLRDGSLIGTWPINKIKREELIFHMVGRSLDKIYPVRNPAIGDVVFEVKDISRHGEFKDVSFCVHAGEIVGVAGLVGAGRTETMQAVFGIHPIDHGEVYLHGKRLKVKNPRDAVKHGIAYIPEDRKEMGLILSLNVEKNLSIPSLKRIINRAGMISNDKERELINKQISTIQIKTRDPKKRVSNLSGGNQQKVVLGKWLALSPKVLILDEPTKGVDVGAKYEIYSIISNYAAEGYAIIMVSSEMPELIGMSDRIVVFNNGTVSGTLLKEDFSQERILNLEISGVV